MWVSRLQSLVAYLSKEDEEGRGKRGRWTRRLDLYFLSFERDWHEFPQINGARTNILDSWNGTISLDLIPNLTVLDIFSKYRPPIVGHTIHFFQTIGKLEDLRRVEWRIHGADLNDLRELSIHCPRLNHIAFELIHTRVHGDFTISLPHVESMVLHLTGPPLPVLSVHHGTSRNCIISDFVPNTRANIKVSFKRYYIPQKIISRPWIWWITEEKCSPCSPWISDALFPKWRRSILILRDSTT